uniref:Integrin beta-PS n=1 Tax=Lygus hesperus TaxID=30085 RepID=A0A0A9WZ71_LYGHE
MKTRWLWGLCLFGAVVSQQGEKTQNPCVSLQTCHQCIQEPTCAWCFQPDFAEDQKRCFQPNQNTDQNQCDEAYIYNPDNEYSIERKQQLTNLASHSPNISSPRPPRRRHHLPLPHLLRLLTHHTLLVPPVPVLIPFRSIHKKCDSNSE